VLPNADARKITREEHEDARQVAREIAKTKQYAISMRSEKERLNALRSPQTQSWLGTAAITRPHVAQMTNFSSPHRPNFRNISQDLYLHRSKRAKP